MWWFGFIGRYFDLDRFMSGLVYYHEGCESIEYETILTLLSINRARITIILNANEHLLIHFPAVNFETYKILFSFHAAKLFQWNGHRGG